MGHRCPSYRGPEPVRGLVKLSWWVRQHDPDNHSLYRPNLPSCYPLPAQLFYEEIVICHHAQDAECKSHDYFYKGIHWIFALPKLWGLLFQQQMMGM